MAPDKVEDLRVGMQFIHYNKKTHTITKLDNDNTCWLNDGNMEFQYFSAWLINNPVWKYVQKPLDAAIPKIEAALNKPKCNHSWYSDKYFTARTYITCRNCGARKEDT